MLTKADVENFVESISTVRRKKIWRTKFKNFLGQEKVLTDAQKREISEFYKPYVKKVDMVFHELLTKKTGKYCKNYIPNDLHYSKIDPYFNDWKAANYLDNKCFYDEWYFKGLNMPKTIARCVNGMWIIKNEDETQFISAEQAYELISQNNCFLKQATLSSGGYGVRKITKGTSTDEIKKIVALLGKDIIAQEAIIQSDELCKLNQNSVNTIRVLSLLKKDGTVKIYSAVVRMGINNSFVDNASSGGITCGIEEDGRLKPVAYAVDGTRYDCHPTTGLKFDDVVIPNYEKVISHVQKLHKDFPHFRLVSWDFAIDKNDEPLFIEVNLCYGGIDVHQFSNGPIFGDDTEKILNEVFGKSK